MKIGDKVRFLNQTGGGMVVGFGKKGWVTVEDEDGFEIPVPERECVVVEENAAAAEGKNIQTKDGEKLNIALAYDKAGAGFACSMANECNYNLLVTYSVQTVKKDGTTAHLTMFAGEVIPYEVKELFRFGKEELNDFSKRVLVRIVPFKRGQGLKNTSAHALKPVIEKDFVLDPINLLKDGMYKENDYTTGKSYIIPMVNENLKELPLIQTADDDKLRQALKEKFQGEKECAQGGNRQGAGNSTGNTAGNRAFINGKWVEISKGNKEAIEEKALIKTSATGILEVDLHASALLETTAGMDNTAILKYQMEKFNEAMKTVIRKKGQRIVFIHGKGDGVLRKAILSELKTKYPTCRWQDASFKEYGYGATMVTV